MITLSGLRKTYPGGVTALDRIDLSVPSGSIHGIVGRSGAGKSTLIRCLTGLEPVTEGSVVIDGLDIAAARGTQLRQARRNIGMVFQHVNLMDSRTALGNIEHPLAVAGVSKAERRRRALELLELVGLADRGGNYPSQLSGGQKQRVGIARALATRPGVLLCDEPTSALDSSTTGQILGLIRTLRDELGITVLIITHEMSVVREVCDGVTLLEDGRVAVSGSLAEVITDTESPLSRELVPLPAMPPTDATRVEVLLGRSGLGAGEFFDALRSTGIDAKVDAGTVETIDGMQVGRFHLTTDSPARAQGLVDALGSHNLDVKVLP